LKIDSPGQGAFIGFRNTGETLFAEYSSNEWVDRVYRQPVEAFCQFEVRNFSNSSFSRALRESNKASGINESSLRERSVTADLASTT
jgi:hypothetical protein